MKNRLHEQFPPEARVELIAHNRCRGITTGQALRAIGKAILKPGEWVEIQDHFALMTQGRSNDAQISVIQEIVGRLGLRCFELKKGAVGHQYFIRSNHIVADDDDGLSKNAKKSTILLQ